MSQKVEINGEEVEVYTATEVQEREAAIAKAKEEEFNPKLSAAEQERARLEGLLKVRSQEFKEFRELTEDQKAKLTEAELTLYENQRLIEQMRKDNQEADRKTYEHTVASAIRAQVGTDEKLFEEVQKMYDLIGLDDTTEAGVKQRVTAAIGALRHTQPNLLATINVSASGGFEPPKPQGQEPQTYADTQEGKRLADRLGLVVEPPKQQ